MIIHAAGPYLVDLIILSHHLADTSDPSPNDDSNGADIGSPATEFSRQLVLVILLMILRCLDTVLPPPPLLLDPFPLDDILNFSENF